MEGIYPTVFYRGGKPELIVACIRTNLAGCAYQDKDLNEQHRDAKKSRLRGNAERDKGILTIRS